MNGYVGFWKGKRVEVRAEDAYEARDKMFKMLSYGTKKVYAHDIGVMISERDGETVEHHGTPWF